MKFLPYLIANILIAFDSANIGEIPELIHLFSYINQSLYYFTKKHQPQVVNLQNKQPLMRNKNKQKCRELYTIEFLPTTLTHIHKKAVSYRHCWGKRALQAGKDCKTLGEGEVVPLRFERGLREPKTLVLPLHHGTSTKGHFCSLQCKSTTSFPNNQILAHKKCSVQTKVDTKVVHMPFREHKTRTKR